MEGRTADVGRPTLASGEAVLRTAVAGRRPADYEKFYPEVREALSAFEKHRLAEQPMVERTAATLYRALRPRLARRYLTFYSQTQARDALRLGEALLAGVEARTKLLFGIREPRIRRINSTGGTTPNCLLGGDPDRPARSRAGRVKR